MKRNEVTDFVRRFGSYDCRIEVQSEGIGLYSARLFTLQQERRMPILDWSGQPIVLTAGSPAWAYLTATRFLTERFGPELSAPS